MADRSENVAPEDVYDPERPLCEGCGEPFEIDDNRGRYWCTDCFFDGSKS